MWIFSKSAKIIHFAIELSNRNRYKQVFVHYLLKIVLFYFINNRFRLSDLDSVDLQSISSNSTFVRFEFTNPRSCYGDVSVICDNANSTSAVLNNQTLTGVCANLIPGTNYSIVSINQYVKRNKTRSWFQFTSKPYFIEKIFYDLCEDEK